MDYLKNVPKLEEDLTVTPNGVLNRNGRPLGRFEVGSGLDSLVFDQGTSRGLLSTPSLQIRGGFKFARKAVTSNYSVTVFDYLIGVTSLATAPTVELPHPLTAGAGKSYIIKDEAGGASSTNITIRSAGERNIDGSSSASITSDFSARSFYTDGNNWFNF